MSTRRGVAPFEHHALGLARIAFHHAVADEAVADARQHRRLAQRPRELHGGRDRRGEVCRVRTTSSSGITFAGEKKCRPITSAGRAVADAISSMSSVEVLVASTAPRLRDPIELRKTLFFRSMLLDGRLDDHVGIGKLAVVDRAVDQRHALAPCLAADAGRA